METNWFDEAQMSPIKPWLTTFLGAYLPESELKEDFLLRCRLYPLKAVCLSDTKLGILRSCIHSLPSFYHQSWCLMHTAETQGIIDLHHMSSSEFLKRLNLQ